MSRKKKIKNYLYTEGSFYSLLGRSRRLAVLAYTLQLCLWVFFLTIFAGGIYFIDLLINSPISNQTLPLAGALELIRLPITIVGTISAVTFLLWAFIAGFALAVRRLHDMNMPGLLVIFAFIPYINVIFFFVILCVRGTNGKNKYGPNPR